MFTSRRISKSRRLKRDALNLRGKFLRNPPITPRTKDVYVSNSVAVQRVGLITCSSPSNERIILPRNDSPADWKLLESGDSRKRFRLARARCATTQNGLVSANTETVEGGACFVAVTTNLHAVPTLRESDTVSNLNGSRRFLSVDRQCGNDENRLLRKLVGRFGILWLTMSNIVDTRKILKLNFRWISFLIGI